MIKKLVWSKNLEPTLHIKQNHCFAKTPIGNIVIKWNEGKRNDWPVIHAPWGAWGWGGSIEEAKEEAEREYLKRITTCLEEKE